MRILFFAFTFLFTLNLFSQIEEKNSPAGQLDYRRLIFDKGDGYTIDELHSMEFDDDGWLWLSGIRYESVDYKVGTRNPVLLRFNGQFFYEIPIPVELLDGSAVLILQKAFDNSFYIKVVSSDDSKLFKIDARSLITEEINRPGEGQINGEQFELLKLRDNFLYVEDHPAGNKIYFLNADDTFEYSGSMQSNAHVIGSRGMEIGDDILVCKFNFGPEIFSVTTGNRSFDSNIEQRVESYFYKGKDTYLSFYGNPAFYRYNEATKGVDETQILSGGAEKFNNQIAFQDKFENVLVERIDGQFSKLNILSDVEEEPIWTYEFTHLTGEGSVFASRDLTKELIVENDGELEVFIFNSDLVKTYLGGLSIRDMLELNDRSVVITTDFDGWYKLDSARSNIRPIWPLVESNKLSPLLNRSIYLNDSIVWSNDSRNLLRVDLTTLSTDTFDLSANIAAMAQDDDWIVLADEELNVKRFDKTTFSIETIIEKDSLIYQNIKLLNNSVYAATSGGVKLIQSNHSTLFKPSEDAAENYFVSLIPFGSNQLLLGSKTGKLYRFDTDKKTFELLYQDDLNASIASIVIDDASRIWLNTFAGIVAFDPDTNEAVRFGMNDGLSHYECNRFSAVKLSDGNLMIGTVKGVNCFHPDSLIASHRPSEQDHQLRFVSIEYFDAESETNQKILNRNKLDSTQYITLPADNKNLVLDFGLLKPRLNMSYFYRYRIGSSDWIDLEKKHQIRLVNMEAGRYDVEIQAIDKIKLEVLSTLSLGLVVEEFFYESYWFYLLLLVIISGVVFIYSYKSKQAEKAHYKNKLLRTEIEYKKKDLADFASNISRNQQWNDYLISKMEEIKESKGRKKGAALVNLEKEIREKNTILENNFEFQKRIDVLSNEFYNSLLQRFPNLSKNEVKLCSLIRLDLDNNDIAILQNVTVDAIYKSRYRLRKKLNITSDTDLNAFLKSF